MKSFDKRFFSSWTFGNPFTLRFLPAAAIEDPPAAPADGDPPEPPAAPVDLPEWLNEPQYAEILKDDANRNILSRYKDRTEAVKALAEKEKTVRSGFKIPQRLNDEQRAELRAHMDKINGVPEKPEGYKMARPEQIDESLDLSEQTKMELRAVAKEHRIGDAAFQAIYEKALYAMDRAHTEALAAREAQFENDRKLTVAAMQKYFGPQEYQTLTGDDTHEGMIDKFAKSRAADVHEYNDLFTRLEETGLRNNSLLFKLIGDGARMFQILEGQAPGFHPEFAATKGAHAQSEEAKYARLFPNTPASHGGGAPG